MYCALSSTEGIDRIWICILHLLLNLHVFLAASIERFVLLESTDLLKNLKCVCNSFLRLWDFTNGFLFGGYHCFFLDEFSLLYRYRHIYISILSSSWEWVESHQIWIWFCVVAVVWVSIDLSHPLIKGTHLRKNTVWGCRIWENYYVVLAWSLSALV